MRGSVDINDIIPKSSKIEKKYIRKYLKIITTSKGERQKKLLEGLIEESQAENVDIVKIILDFKSNLERKRY